MFALGLALSFPAVAMHCAAQSAVGNAPSDFRLHPPTAAPEVQNQ
jgi:hypothetical protein